MSFWPTKCVRWMLVDSVRKTPHSSGSSSGLERLSSWPHLLGAIRDSLHFLQSQIVEKSCRIDTIFYVCFRRRCLRDATRAAQVVAVHRRAIRSKTV